MNSISGLALLLVGVLFGAFGLYRLGAWLGGKKLPWVGAAFMAAGLFASPWLLIALLDRAGVVEKVVVADRRETVSVGLNGAPRAERWISIKEAAGTGGLRRVRADQESYDLVAFGDPIEVRYLPIWKSFIRLERSPSSAWLATFPAFRWGIGLLAVAAVTFGLLLFGGKGSKGLIRRAVGAVLLGLGCYAAVDQFGPYSGSGTPETAAERGQGTIKRMWRVASLYPASANRDRLFGLERPYRLVAFEFTPARGRGPILAVDAVDDASVTNLAVGDAVTVRYLRANPRQARIDAGTRRFEQDNATGRRIAVLSALGVVAGLLALRALLGR
ncbi:MAG: hypothetical protein FJ206_09685 [Gemmatimonadetes bacterium]|nr:hypothetical protein [Gemmatimonadota bacterium]